MLDAEKNCAEQHRKRAVPVFRAYLFQRPQRPANSSIVVGDVQPSKFADCALDGAAQIAFTFNVGFVEHGAAALFLAITHRGLAALLIQISDDDGGAFTGETDCRSTAHSARRAGNYCNLVIESSHN